MGLFRGRGKIRVRLVVGFLIAFLSMAAFGVVSYAYFFRIEQKLLFLSQGDSMLNDILEARRYEKNFLLYRHQQDFDQAMSYLKTYEAVLRQERDHIQRHWGSAEWTELKSLADGYRNRLTLTGELLAKLDRNDPRVDRAVAGLRETGKNLIDNTERIALQERRTISSLLRDYRPLLLGFLVLLAGIGVWLAHFLIVRLVRPLQVIEGSTELVTSGEHTTIPWEGSHRDEIDSMVQSFNNMVTQLRRHNEQMVQTEKLTSLGTLTSGVAHELNNPLNNISTSCQILMEELEAAVSAYHRELLEAIEDQVSKARDIVSSLLEFARQREFELRREDLRTVVLDTQKLLRGEIPAGVELEVDVPEGLVLQMDKAHMVQALLNLIINSIQEMPDGGRITIRGRLEPGRGRVALEVSDNGPGIEPAVLPRIFDPFFTTKEIGRGTGLGLSITYGIVERHHGRIEAFSTPGRGARFLVSLPLEGGEG